MSIALAHQAASLAPSEAQLRAAYDRSRKDFWPATFEEAMEHPTYSRLVQINARHPAPAPAPRRAHPWPFMAAARYRPAPAANVPRWTPARVFDIKRAAAGDRDD